MSIGVSPLSKSAGFSMIEIMVSFLVLAAGLLGVATMQQRGMDSSHAAYLRTQAVSLAQDMSSRARANRRGANAGKYDKPQANYQASCLAGGCSAEQMAAHDNAEWQADLAQILPFGEGVVCVDSTPEDGDGAASAACDGIGRGLAIKIWWDAVPRDGVIDQRYVILMQR